MYSIYILRDDRYAEWIAGVDAWMGHLDECIKRGLENSGQPPGFYNVALMRESTGRAWDPIISSDGELIQTFVYEICELDGQMTAQRVH